MGTTAHERPFILYVEDEIIIQQALASELEDAGFHVITADQGEEALELLSKHSQDLHGLITDVKLREGPDGWQVARRARELVSGLPVIYLSATCEEAWTSLGVPNSVMINKPFVAAQLIVAISSLLNLAKQ